MKFALGNAEEMFWHCDQKYVKLLTDNGFKVTEEEEKLCEDAIARGDTPALETMVEIETLEDLKRLVEVVGHAIVITEDWAGITIYDDYIE